MKVHSYHNGIPVYSIEPSDKAYLSYIYPDICDEAEFMSEIARATRLFYRSLNKKKTNKKHHNPK